MTIHDNEVLFYTGKDVQMEFELTNQIHKCLLNNSNTGFYW